jgi:hypothetical protein
MAAASALVMQPLSAMATARPLMHAWYGHSTSMSRASSHCLSPWASPSDTIVSARTRTENSVETMRTVEPEALAARSMRTRAVSASSSLDGGFATRRERLPARSASDASASSPACPSEPTYTTLSSSTTHSPSTSRSVHLT